MLKSLRLTTLFVLLSFFSVSFGQNKQEEKSISKDTIRINEIIHEMEKYAGWSKEHIALYSQLPAIFTKGLQIKNLDLKAKNKYIEAAGVYYYYTAKKETQNGDRKAIEHYDKAINYYNQIKSYDNKAYALLGKGTFYLYTTDYTNAYKAYFDALKYFEKSNNKAGISAVYQEIGRAYMTQYDWQNGIIYLEKALHIDSQKKKSEMNLSDRRELAVIHNNLGVCYYRLKDFNKTHDNFLKAYEYIKLNNDNQSESIVLVQLANSANDLDKKEEALDYLNRALSLAPDDLSKAGVYGNATRMYYKNKDYEKAIEFGQMNYSLSKKANDLKSMLAISNLLTKIYKESGKFEEALHFAQTAETLKDSINILSSKNELEQQKIKFEFEKKELQQKITQEKEISAIKLKAQQEKTEQDAKNKLDQQVLKYNLEKKALTEKVEQEKKLLAIKIDNQKIKLDAEKKAVVKNNWLIGLSGTLFLLLLGLYFYYRNNKQKQAIARLEKEQIKQKLLVTQMNPHFVFNSIDNIQGLIHYKKDTEAINYLSKFSKLTRQILENSTQNYISLEEEIEMTQNYLSIQQLLYNNKFSYHIVVEDNINQEAIFLPPMLTQPFIENAIKHGLSNTSENGKIAIHFYLKNNKLFFEISDNGKGFNTEKKVSNHKSLAMTITKERLITYTKNQDFIVHTDNIKDNNEKIVGAKVSFEIPYIYEK